MSLFSSLLLSSRPCFFLPSLCPFFGPHRKVSGSSGRHLSTRMAKGKRLPRGGGDSGKGGWHGGHKGHHVVHEGKGKGMLA
jgi:hypothetical protein